MGEKNAKEDPAPGTAAYKLTEPGLRRIFDSAAIPMAIVNSDGVIEYINNKVEQLFGYRHSDIPDMDRWWKLAYPEEDYRRQVIESWTGKVREAMEKNAEIDGGEYRITCRDGSVRTCRFFGTIVEGKAVILLEDVSGQAQAEAALRESESALRRIIDSAPMSMAIVNMNGTIEYINRKAEETFGYPHSDIPDMDRWWAQAYPDENYRKEVVERWMGNVYKAYEAKTEIEGGEYRVTCKDGSVKTCHIFGVIAADKVFVMFDDVTKRVKMENALRESEKNLRALFDNAPVAIVIHGLDGTVDFYNRKFLQTFGYTKEEVPTLLEWVKRAYPDENYRKSVLEGWDVQVNKFLKRGLETEPMEVRVVCKDASVKTMVISAVLTPDSKVLALMEDISSRVEAEAGLRERESLYRALVETTGTGYVVLDGHGNVVDANREYVRISGHSDLKEIMGRSVLEWSAPHSQKRALEAVEIVVREGRLSNFELDYVDRTGKFTTIEINATVVSRNGVRQILGLCRDVSARSKTEAELRDSESLYRALVETTRTGYVVIDTAGKVVDANREYIRLTGHSDLKEILGRRVVEWTAPDKVEQNAAAVAQCARDGYIFSFETDYIGKNGKRTPIEINATVASRGGIPQIHTLCRDISQRRRRDQELSLLNQSLERRVEERTAELMKANIELSQEIAQRMDAEKEKGKLQEELEQSQKMELVGRLAGGIAHDFNNILVAISGYAEFLMKTLPKDSPALADLGEIVLETERGALLTRQLTAIGRKQPLESKVISLNAAAEDSCRMLKRLIGANMHLDIRPDPALENIKADPGQVSQVIMNLIVNARDAMPEGGKITISTANEEVTAQTDGMRLAPKPGHYVTITVSDTGTGMPPATAARIFEPFFTTKEQGQGTGLGLSTVYNIVSQAHGGIGLKTGPGKGTTFRIYFPRTLERV